MPTVPIPEHVARIVDTNVDSIEPLEILRVLGEDPEKRWSAVDLSRAAQVEPSMMAAHLAALEGRGLFRTEAQTQLFCRLAPRDDSLRQQVDQLLQ